MTAEKIDDLDREILRTVELSGGATIAETTKVIAGDGRASYQHKKLYQRLKYRIENLVDDGILILDEKTGKLSLAHEIWRGKLELKSKRKKRILEVGRTILIDDDHGTGVIFMDQTEEE